MNQTHHVARLAGWFLAGTIATLATSSPAAAQLPPAKALQTLQTSDEFEVQLFASEPLVNNPTAIDIDPQGRVWVTEGVNYRHQLRGNTQGQRSDERADRVKILEDVDGDGRADRVTVFAEQLVVPMSVAVAGFATPGQGGKVYVGESPNLWVFEDTDGDGVADTKEALLSGFGGKDHDHGVHGLVLGPGGRLYMTVGDEGLDVTDRSGNRVQPLAGAMLRCNLDGTGLTVLADNFRNPYELAVDSYGEVFCSDNDIDGRRGVRICWILQGGSYGWKGPPSPSGNHWREDLPGYVHKLLGTGNGSPCGILCYEGTLLQKRFMGSLIHADAGTRTINAYHLQPQGAAYAIDAETLISSQDNWFRPVDACTHPDGSIYIADWYDAGVGGHRYSDIDTGRIYRLVPKGKRPEMPQYDWETIGGRIAALHSPNVAARFVASQQLRSAGREQLGALREVATEESADPLASRMRARAQWVLATAGHRPGVDEQRTAADARLRAQQVRMIREEQGRLEQLAARFADQTGGHVVRELILATRGNDSSAARNLLAKFVKQWDGEDHYYLAALGISLRERDAEFIRAIFGPANTRDRETAMVKLAWELQRAEAVPFLHSVVAADNPDALKRSAMEALWHIADPPAGEVLADAAGRDPDAQRRRTALQYLAARLDGPWKVLKEHPPVQAALERALADPQLAVTAVETVATAQLNGFAPRLTAIAGDRQTPAPLRLASIGALGQLGAAGALPVLTELAATPEFDPDDPKADPAAAADPVALAALRAIAQLDVTPAADFVRSLVEQETYLPALRREAVVLLARDTAGANYLLDLAENRRLPAALKGAATQAVHRNNNASVQARAGALLPLPKAATGKPLPAIDELAQRDGNPARGREVFFRKSTAEQAAGGALAEGALCSRCHRVRGQGAWVGPDLSQIGTKLARRGLYDAIINPSAGIAHEYRAFNIVTAQGQVHSGLIVEDQPQQLVLKTAEGERIVIAASQVKEKTAQSVSLMPENLTATLSEADLSDLVAFLETLEEPATSLSQWHVLGQLADLYPDFGANVDLAAKYPGKDGQPVGWRTLPVDREGRMHLAAAGLGAKDPAYLHTAFQSPKDQRARVVIDTPGGASLSVNGQQLRFRSTEEGGKHRLFVFQFDLKKGANELLVLLANAGQDGDAYVTLISDAPVQQ